MSSILEWLVGNNVPVIFILFLTVIVFLIALYKDANTVREMLLKCKALSKKIWYFSVNRKRKKYNAVLGSAEYIKWQNLIMKTIYSPLADRFNQNADPEHQCFFAHSPYSNEKDAHKYEALCFRSINEYRYPFEELCNKRELDVRNLEGKSHKKSSRSQRAYYRMMKPVVSFPNSVGYMLKEIDLKGNFHFQAYCDVYSENIKASHILEYELFKLYKKYPRYVLCPERQQSEAKHRCLYLGADAAAFLLDLLPMRKKIHQKTADLPDGIFASGAGRKSLLSVQAIVLCKNHNGRYDVLRIRRSEHVDTKSGFIQFIPSGGFSALNSGLDFDTQYFNFSLLKAILREFLEECYGVEDFSGRKDESPEKVYVHPIIQKLLSQNEEIRFVGTAMGLITLRQELCFVIILDDPSFSEEIKQNEEAKNIIQFVPTECLSDENFWTHGLGKDELTDEMLLNCTSAALWNLVQNSKVYHEKIMAEKDKP